MVVVAQWGPGGRCLLSAVGFFLFILFWKENGLDHTWSLHCWAIPATLCPSLSLSTHLNNGFKTAYFSMV